MRNIFYGCIHNYPFLFNEFWSSSDIGFCVRHRIWNSTKKSVLNYWLCIVYGCAATVHSFFCCWFKMKFIELSCEELWRWNKWRWMWWNNWKCSFWLFTLNGPKTSRMYLFKFSVRIWTKKKKNIFKCKKFEISFLECLR